MLGTKIKKLRELKNYSQEYVAEQIGISQSTLARMEKNEILINESRLKQIAYILNTTTETILNFDEMKFFQNDKIGSKTTNNWTQEACYHISPELKQLYEEQISLLKDKINYLEDHIRSIITK